VRGRKRKSEIKGEWGGVSKGEKRGAYTRRGGEIQRTGRDKEKS
jgi:hypothetical protein